MSQLLLNEEQGDSPALTVAPSPYPNRLQHREFVPGLHSAVECTAWEHVRRPLSASTDPNARQSLVVTEADRAALEEAALKAAAAAQMAASGAARTQRAVEVIESSGIPLATPAAAGPSSGGCTNDDDDGACSYMRDVFQAACDGDVAMLEACLRPSNGAADGPVVDINAIGQPNPRNYKGVQFEKRWTFAAPPLVFAAAFNRERAVAALVAWGADVHATSTTGLTAKQYAQQRGYATIAQILEDAE